MAEHQSFFTCFRTVVVQSEIYAVFHLWQCHYLLHLWMFSGTGVEVYSPIAANRKSGVGIPVTRYLDLCQWAQAPRDRARVWDSWSSHLPSWLSLPPRGGGEKHAWHWAGNEGIEHSYQPVELWGKSRECLPKVILTHFNQWWGVQQSTEMSAALWDLSPLLIFTTSPWQLI